MMHQFIKVKGCIQGVGFRPFVYKLAKSLSLKGGVQNQSDGVYIEVLGDSSVIKIFNQKLRQEHPAHARIDSISYPEKSEFKGKFLTDFQILNQPQAETALQNSATEIPADLRVCQACIKELFDPTNRRYLYSFINCTQCGPRYSIINALPYDRKHTSMSSFKMCQKCLQEYQSPDQRRFHAQPIACEQCGPKHTLYKTNRLDQSKVKKISNNQAIQQTARLLMAGKIIAVKGIGGFHLMCDARNVETVQKLRQCKRRPDKPFAIMALNTASIEHLVKLDAANKTQLNDVAAPIVLLPKQPSCDEELKGIATDVSDLGCLLPYSPLHYLLFHSLIDEPDKSDWLNQSHAPLLVVTSGNRSGEPLVTSNESCLEKLADIADYFLFNDREIVAGCDDSVLQTDKQPSKGSALIRRARGYTPQSITLPEAGPSVLALGSYLKNTFCVTHQNKAYLSTYMGELDNVESRLNYLETIKQTLKKLNIKPDLIACDLHPDFYSTQVAEEYSQNLNIPLIQVQHHRAHISAVIAEQDIKGPVLALALDGTGLGDNNKPWGGELFFGEVCRLNRIGHLSPIPLPGGDIATKEIWRMGAELLSNINHQKIELSTRNTTSVGRWFDAITALLNIRTQVTFEGQAAMHLEHLAQLYGTLPETQNLAIVNANGELDLYPIIPLLLRLDNAKQAAAHFHTELIDGLVRWVCRAALKWPTKKIVCSGGCFQNKIIRHGLKTRLEIIGYGVYFPQQHPANDGGISLGQAWVASQQFNKDF
jgi:hydrogenase maturation protein HypF